MRRILVAAIAALSASACNPNWPPTNKDVANAVARKSRSMGSRERCTLPPLETFSLRPTRCTNEGPGWVCYDPVNADRLEQQIAAINEWIRVAGGRCGVQINQPAKDSRARRNQSRTGSAPQGASQNAFAASDEYIADSTAHERYR